MVPEHYINLSCVLELAGRPDEALAALRHGEQLGFAGPLAADIRARAALLKGDAREAARLCAGEGDWYLTVCLAMADHMLGDQTTADAKLAKLRAMLGDSGAYQYARIYAAWGRPEDALSWLETAYRLRDDGMLDLEVDPVFGAIRDRARFKAIEGELGMKAI